MKDQKTLLNKCLQNDVPAFVISGNDSIAVPVIEAYLQEAIKQGCTNEFINDLNTVLIEFKMHQAQEPDNVKKPD